MQSGKDEYGNGPISAPAAALSNWASHLRSTPVIGRYATATQIGASAVSQIAKLFGWSNVPVIEDVKPVKNVPFHDMASAHLSEPTSKMTLDPKGEISVDPRIIGMEPVDDLAISNLVQRESFLCSTQWNTTDNIGTQYFIGQATPMLYDRGTASTNGTYGIAMTPMCWVSRAFGSWSGDIIFRFKIICSRFHQGRLRISWDPFAANSTATDTTNVILTKVIDLAESDEVEFRVPYMQAASWSKTFTSNTEIIAGNNWNNGTGSLTVYADNCNGIITVKNLTNLSAPIDSSYVTLLVFVRAADNFMLANPVDLPAQVTQLQMQSGTAAIEDDHMDSNLFKVNFGDPVLSLRTLMRRTMRHDSFLVKNQTSSTQHSIIRQGRRPLHPGYSSTGYYSAKGVEVPGSSFYFNGVHMTHIAWFAPAFVACRGSVRWHYNVSSAKATATEAVGQIEIVRSQTPVTSANQFDTAIWSSTTPKTLDIWKYDLIEKGASGLCLTNQRTQTGISVEMPMNTNYKYIYTKADNALVGTSIDGSDTDTYAVRILVQSTGAETSELITRYVSAGTDFGLYFFLSVPVVYYNANMGMTYP
jgi:hypothetical protein